MIFVVPLAGCPFDKFARAVAIGLMGITLSWAGAAPALARHKPAAKEKAEIAKTKDVKEQSESKAGKKSDKKSDKKTDKRSDKKKDDKGAALEKPPQIVPAGRFGDWLVYVAQGKDKTCYALASPKDRQPAKLKRDNAYIFISSRRGEGVRNEVAIVLGFATKDFGSASAEIDGDDFGLVAMGTTAWVKNPAEEKEIVDTMKKGAKLVVKATSVKGNLTTDSYSLSGLSQALERVQKECQ